MDWIRGRKPTKDELHVIFKRDDYTAYGAVFLVCYKGGMVDLCQFTMPPDTENGGYYPGYWNTGVGEAPIAWMPLPDPPEWLKKEDE